MGRGADAGSPRVPVDGHVHLYTLERAAATFDSAETNFRGFGGKEAGCAGILLLTQTSREHVFEALREQRSCGSWDIRLSLAEDQSLAMERDGHWLIVICGRQIRCKDGLEVAALGTTAEFPDGMAFEEAVARVQASDAVTALPWGFGKWTGARGRAVRAVLKRHAPNSMTVGDNGGRLALLGQPALIRAAGKAGYRLLSGSDPFPCGDDHRRVGSFGFLVGVDPGLTAPWRNLSAWLHAQTGPLEAYGRAVGPMTFLSNQLGIRRYNRQSARASA
jgi:hypothetical protein